MPVDPSIPIAIAQAGINAISQGGPRRQYKWNKRAMQDANAMNRANAEWALAQNRMLLDEQRMYDSPQAQMDRYKAAGLNPHLIYDKITGVSSPISTGMPAASMQPPDASYPDPSKAFQESMLAQSQVQLQQQKVAESEAKIEVMDAQKGLIKANPYMRPQYVDALVKQLEAVAIDKSNITKEKWKTYWQVDGVGGFEKSTLGAKEIALTIQNLEQKYELSKKDQEVKAKIVESKEFENDLKEIERNWMRNGDITPQHIYQGIMMLLMKLR